MALYRHETSATDPHQQAAYAAAKGQLEFGPEVILANRRAAARAQELQAATEQLIERFSPMPRELPGKTYDNMTHAERKTRIDWLFARSEVLSTIEAALTAAKSKNETAICAHMTPKP